jgi:hypothetical protein
MNNMKYVDMKIEDAYNVALKLGLESASEFDKQIFKMTLRSIAVAAIDDTRNKIEKLMHDESNSYIK